MSPERTRPLAWEYAGEFYILHDEKDNSHYKLDPLAFLVWAQCDGHTDVEEMVSVLAADKGSDIVRTTVLNTVDRLQEMGLVKR